MTQQLSIITPTLNCAPTLVDTLASLRPLIETGAEHLVVDSGSTDGTVELAERSGARVLYHPRGNMYAAINAGVRQSKGTWVTYINGDDVLYSDAVMDGLRRHAESSDVIYGNVDYIDDRSRFLFSWRTPAPARLAALMLHYSAVLQQGTLFRREVFDRLGGFDTRYRYSADYDFWARALEAGLRFSQYRYSTMAGFRLASGQLSQSRKVEMAPEGVAVRKRLQQCRPRSLLLVGAFWALLYRRATNLDSYWLRAWRGRRLDQR